MKTYTSIENYGYRGAGTQYTIIVGDDGTCLAAYHSNGRNHPKVVPGMFSMSGFKVGQKVNPILMEWVERTFEAA